MFCDLTDDYKSRDNIIAITFKEGINFVRRFK